jgi:hypothetical protein
MRDDAITAAALFPLDDGVRRAFLHRRALRFSLPP